VAGFRRGEESYEEDRGLRPQRCQDRSQPRSRWAMSLKPPRQQPETVAKSKKLAARRSCVRVGSTGSSMGRVPEASRHAGDSRPQEPSANASRWSLAGAKKLQSSPTTETRSAVLSYASPSSPIICASRRAKIRRAGQGKVVHRSNRAQAGMAELANALDLGIVPSLPASFRFAGGGVRRRIHGLVLLPSNSSDKSQSQSGYYRMNDGGKGQGNKRVDRDRNLPPREHKWAGEQHQFR
jgi:hypothetical protein